MIKLGQLQPDAAVREVVPAAMVAVVSVQWFGSETLELTDKTPTGKVANELVYCVQGHCWLVDANQDGQPSEIPITPAGPTRACSLAELLDRLDYTSPPMTLDRADLNPGHIHALA